MPGTGVYIKSLEVSSARKRLLHNMALTIPAGEMVAIIGGAGAGKSLLLRSLSNYIPTSLNVQKDVLPLHISTGFVPTEDILIGELTIRETLRYSAQLRCPHEASADREARLQQMIDDFDLSKVADNQIGTILKRGISGGQKRRVSVLVECAAQPDFLLLDEPTSGLDSSTALSVCQSIARLAKQRNTVVMATLQQPNTRLLEQFHQVVVMNAGHVVFIGAVGAMQQWFARLGYSLPSEGAISDHVASLLGSDKRAVAVAARLHKQTYRLQETREQTSWVTGTRPAASSAIATTWSAKLLWNQYAVLTRRFAVVAQRSLPLYWLQFLLVSGFGFLIGVVFWQLPFVAGARINNLPNGLTWLVYVASYIQVFRIFYQADMRDRYRHEKDTNLSFNVVAWSMADLTVTSAGVLLAFIPGLLIALFMMGVPFSSIGYSVLVLWTTAMTTEALLTIIVQLVQDVPYAVLVSQGVLVFSSVFAGGAFIGFDRVDHNFWVWLQNISLYNFASRAIEIFVFQRLSYTCHTASSANECLLATYSIPCATASSANGVCELNGLDVLASTTGLTQVAPWLNYGVLVALFVAFRAITVVIQALRPMQSFSKLRVGASTTPTAGDVEVAPVPCAKADCNNNMHSINATHLAIDVDPDVKSPTVESSYDTTQDRQATVSVLEWTDVELRLRSNKQTLVTGMSGYTVSGQLLAILGGSGAGKTTFLNALAYRAPYANISGKVTLNGRPLQRSDLVYVPQFDSLNPRMTCHDSLVYTAELYGKSRAEGHRRSEQLLQLLDLSNRADALVATLTFGERKRVAVAMGLLSSAPILVLDEPTTGLDAYNAQILVNYVAKLVKSTNVMCLMTVHQPGTQLLASFDTLMLLTRGTTAYFGPAKHTEQYFSNLGLSIPPGTNPADFYLDCITQKPTDFHGEVDAEHARHLDAEDWYEVYAKHTAAIPQLRPSSSTPLQNIDIHYSEAHRFVILLRYLLQYFVRERSLYLLRGVSVVVLALFIGSLYFQLSPADITEVPTIAGFVFFSTWATLFAAVSGIVVHARDRLTTENEYLNGAYQLSTVLLATLVASIPFHLTIGLLYNVVMWVMVGVHNSGGAYIYAALMTTVLLMMMESVALIVVAELKDAMLSTTFSMVTLGTFYLFAGFFVQQQDMVRSVFWACYLVPTKYSLNGQLDNIMVGNVYSQPAAGVVVPGSQILSQFFAISSSLELSRWGNWGIVIAFAAGLRVLHWVLLTVQYRKYQSN